MLLQLLVLLFCLVLNEGYLFPQDTRRRVSSSSSSSSKLFDSPVQNVIQKKLDLVKPIAPLLGWFALALAPIYGIGFGPFGSMTDFDTLTNRPGGELANEYITTPRGYSSNLRINHESKFYDINYVELEKALTKVIERQPRMTYIATDSETGRKEYVQRTPIFRFPDVLTFKTIPVDKNFDLCQPERSEKCSKAPISTIALHSYSIYGGSDLGVNRKRVNTILDELLVYLSTSSEYKDSYLDFTPSVDSSSSKAGQKLK